MMISDEINMEDLIETLVELKDDSAVPRNVREKINSSINILKCEEEMSLKVNKALNELGEVADDPNMQSFTRTQIWNIVSLLEKF